MPGASEPSLPSGRARTGTGGTSKPVYRLEIGLKPGLLDPAGAEACADLVDSGLAGLDHVRVLRVFFLRGALTPAEVERAAVEVLADPVQEVYAVREDLDLDQAGQHAEPQLVTVLRKPGVTNPEAESARVALQGVGISVDDVQSARTYAVWTAAPQADVLAAARATLGNDVIEDVVSGRVRSYVFPRPTKARIRRRTVPIRRLAGKALVTLSYTMGLSLSREEMETIRDHYKALRREPTDVELETLAQTWSEHCKHKTLTGTVRMVDEDGERVYDNLLKETIFDATTRLDRSWCWSVFEDNAGVIDFDGEDGVCMKVETHNHPSAIEPYGGAGTGIGGVIRDILGTGLGARPIMNTDVFCFAPPDTPESGVPKGCLHPHRILHGVVSGVRDYGNRMGIPTASGGLFFDPRYVGNPLVYCGTVGLIPRRDVQKAARPGDRILSVGGRTGRDGIHGATFSSVELTHESETVSAGAVQIGNPIEEKRVLDGLLVARDEGLLSAVTDCGAGGFSSAVGEMGEETGALVELERAPLKYQGLSCSEIWISEAQERMVLAVAPENVARVREIFETENVEVTDLGAFTGDHRLRLRYDGELVCDLPLEFVHDGLPRVSRDAVWEPPAGGAFPWDSLDADAAPGADLKAILGSWNVCSKEWVIRQYDHEVQGLGAVGPLVGERCDGPGDAAVVTPLAGNPRGVAVSSGLNPRLGDASPYDMATNAVDEALRNLCAVGADPRRAALLDNFSWGNCAKPERLGSLVLASEGLRDAALAFGTPFVSGKDSLNNEYQAGDRTIAVPPTLLVSAFAVVDDVRTCVTMDLKEAGNRLFQVGLTRDEMGGSHFALVRGVAAGGVVPRVRLPEAGAVLDGVHRAIQAGSVRSCHDLSEGGAAVALAEMAFAGGLGADVALVHAPFEGDSVRDEVLLFAESPSRLLCEVRPDDVAAFRSALGDVPFAEVGAVTDAGRLRIRGARDHVVVDEDIEDLRAAFTAPLADGAAAAWEAAS